MEKKIIVREKISAYEFVESHCIHNGTVRISTSRVREDVDQL